VLSSRDADRAPREPLPAGPGRTPRTRDRASSRPRSTRRRGPSLASPTTARPAPHRDTAPTHVAPPLALYETAPRPEAAPHFTATPQAPPPPTLASPH
jgi:hypothetical protein